MPKSLTATAVPVRIPVLLAAAGLGLAAARAFGQGDPLGEPFPAVFELSSLLPASGGDGSLGFVLVSSRSDVGLGVTVDAADVDGDGIDDVVAGSIGQLSSGSVYVIFGVPGQRQATRDVQLPGPTDRVHLFPSRPGGTRGLGGSLSMGDLDGDGFDDFVVGARRTTFDPFLDCYDSGNAFAVVGRERAAWPDRLPIETQPQLDPGCDYYASHGTAVGMGDFDGDGIDDIVVSAPHPYGTAGRRPAMVTIYRGAAPPFVEEIAKIEPGSSDTLLGWFAAFVGDVNSDGLEDVAITESDHPDGSRAYLVFGGASGTVTVDDLTPPDGLMLQEPGWYAGSASYQNVGDVNGDGLDDLAIGDAIGGAVYVI
ncbi:MAG: FG-GAP repeat protein, partial [Planctomycetota bacterium]